MNYYTSSSYKTIWCQTMSLRYFYLQDLVDGISYFLPPILEKLEKCNLTTEISDQNSN